MNGFRFTAVYLVATNLTSMAQAAIINGTITYTRYNGADRLKWVPIVYDSASPSFTLGTPTAIAGIGNGMVGADGLAFDPFNGHILVGAQTNAVHRVNPVGPVVSSASIGAVTAYQLPVAPSDAHVFASGIPSMTSWAPIGPAFVTPGTQRAISGSTGAMTSLIFTPNSDVFYTNASPSGFGPFGRVLLDETLNTAITTSIFGSLPAAHGGVYDPFTGDIILFGDDHITQIDPSTLSIVSDLDLSAVGISVSDLDQGTVDGFGRLYAADNGGKLIFVDYAASGLVGASTNLRGSPFLDTFLDDVAPLVGPGSQVIPEPPSRSVWLSGLALALLAKHRHLRGSGRTMEA